MNRLRYYLAVLVGVSVAGTAIIVAFTMGFYSPVAIGVCVALGLVSAWPGGFWLARWIKRDDPAWDHRRDKPKKS